MASFNTTGLRFFAFTGLTAISAFTRVTVNNNGGIACAGPTGNSDVGVLDLDIGPVAVGSGEVVAAVRMPTCPGSKKYIADTAITAWTYVYKSANGYVSNANSLGSGTGSGFTGVTLGYAAAPSGQPVAATALGSVFEVVPLI